MEKLTINLPAMYGDHHVVEVRRILQELPGVDEIYASSAFQLLEVTYDPTKVNDQAMLLALESAGYLHETGFQTETGVPPASKSDQPEYYRHTAVFEQSKQVIGFAQKVSYSGQSLWPCPGMGILKVEAEE